MKPSLLLVSQVISSSVLLNKIKFYKCLGYNFVFSASIMCEILGLWSITFNKLFQVDPVDSFYTLYLEHNSDLIELDSMKQYNLLQQ